MAGNTIGEVFRVTTWGESHGPAIGAVIDGCPAGVQLDLHLLEGEMARRRPGQGGASSPRKEADQVQLLSGILPGDEKHLVTTTGTPIAMAIYNTDARSSSYDHLRTVYRPGHGDITYQQKYGIRDHRGGGRASARETAARVAAGAVAAQLLEQQEIAVFAFTAALGGVTITSCEPEVRLQNPYCCPDAAAAEEMAKRIREVRSQGDTVGGIVEIRATCPPGLGEPVFAKLEADLGRALLSIGAVKGVEFGAGFGVAEMLGSECNDPILPQGFATNNSGGTLAGISSGQELVIRVAVKPIPSLGREQQTITTDGREVTVKIGGRHDISAIPRIIPVCEAMVRIVLLDHLLRQRTVRFV